MPGDTPKPGQILGGAKVVNLDGHIQGLVIGDHNTVNQHFHTPQEEFPTPRESPRLASRVFGREAMISRICEYIRSESDERVTVLCGMGGMGKSTLASHVSTLPEIETLFADGCFWVDLQNGDILEALSRMALAFGQDVESFENIGSRSRAVRSILHGKQVLIVLDNAWEEPSVAPFLFSVPGVAVLVITRDEGLAYMLTDRVVDVGRLETQAGVELLVEVTGKAAGAGDEELLSGLVEQLGGMPLALELVAKQARKDSRRPGFSWGRVKQRIEEGRQRLGLGRGENTVRNAFEQTWQRALDDDGHRYFSLLGLFPDNDLLTGEIAAAWDLDQDTLDTLGDLIDLSLLRPLDEVTLRLHPLLKDYAIEKLEDIEPEQQAAAHRRVFDFHFGRAAEKPVTMQDIQPVLSAHYHAWKAADRERSGKVFPWYKKSDEASVESTPVPGFLIDHGYRRTLVQHYEIELDLAKDQSVTARAWAEYRLGDALADIGELESALLHLKKALSISDKSDLSEDAKVMDRAKFSYRLGQVSVGLEDYDTAIEAFKTAMEMDRKMDQIPNELITMLQIADLHLRRNGADDFENAIETIQGARERARAEHFPAEEAMALTRLADLTRQQDTAACASYIKAALALDDAQKKNLFEPSTTFGVSAFAGRQGARYATTLGQFAAELTLNNVTGMLETTLSAYVIAVRSAGEASAWFEQSVAFYWLGNLFEHLFLVDGFEAERPASWACYAISDQTTQDMELPPGINPGDRIETRILPQLSEAERQQFEPAIETDPLAIVRKTVDRLANRSLWDEGAIATLV
jgi:tetratricopeptide (TPR) repeat protein